MTAASPTFNDQHINYALADPNSKFVQVVKAAEEKLATEVKKNCEKESNLQDRLSPQVAMIEWSYFDFFSTSTVVFLIVYVARL